VTNLVTCAGCGKKYSGKAPKCPDCGAIFFRCKLCCKPIEPRDKFFIPLTPGELELRGKDVGREKAIRNELSNGGIHLSCVMPYFPSSNYIKCTDCGHSILCPNLSLNSFLMPLPSVPCIHKHPHSYMPSNDSAVLHISECLNCANPQPLGLPLYDCSFCKLPIILAIHDLAYSTIYGGEGQVEVHSFCTGESILWRREQKGKRGWFDFLFGKSDPGKKKEI